MSDLTYSSDLAPRRPQIVGTRGQVPRSTWGNNNPTGRNDTRAEGPLYFKVGPYEVSSLEFAFVNYTAPGNGIVEQAIPNETTVESVFESTSPVVAFRQTFGGVDKGVMSPGAYLKRTDPLNVRLLGSSRHIARTSLTVATAGMLIPGSLSGGAGGASNGFLSTAAASQVMATGAFTNPGSGAAGASIVGPAAILGVPVKRHPSVVLLTDSIGDGVGDTADAEGNISYLAKALGNLTWAGLQNVALPYIKQTVGGDKLSSNQDDNIRKRALWSFATHIIIALGTNDIVGGATFAQMQAFYLSLFRAAKAVRGPYGKALQVIVPLLWPREITTAGNPSTGFGPNGVATQVNAWLKSLEGKGLVDQVFDPAVDQRNPSNPNLWADFYRPGDLVHPTLLGHERGAIEARHVARHFRA